MTLPERFALRGKTAVVTGGAKGIGAAIATVLAGAGAQIIIADLDVEADTHLSADLNGAFHALGVTDWAACSALAEHINPDIVIANAGIVHNGPTAEVNAADLQRLIDVNLSGVFNTLRAFGSGMIARKSGAVVSISAMCGEIVVWPRPRAVYNAAKAGVNLLVKSTAVEWAQHRARVNAVAPGYTATELTLAGQSNPAWFNTWIERTPMARLGTPQEIADAVLFLASDAASFVTATVLKVDDGYTAV